MVSKLTIKNCRLLATHLNQRKDDEGLNILNEIIKGIDKRLGEVIDSKEANE